MQLVNIKKWQRRANRAIKKLTPKSLILMYHRVDEPGIDPWSLAVTPEHFEQQLAILKKHTEPLTLLELSEAHRSGKVPERAVAITFDDGYANNLYNAKPILDQYQIPATVFVTTGYTEKQREYWWDELENIFFKPGRLPETLQLHLNDHPFQYHVGAAVDYTEENRLQDYSSKAWNAKPGSRMALYYAVWQVLQPLTEAERQQALEQIIDWSQDYPQARLSHRPMTREELPDLEAGGWVSIGAHTVNHPFLSAHPGMAQQREIVQSKAYLEQVLQHEVSTFAYPYGDYNRATLSLIKDAGFVCACSTVEETVWKWSDTYRLPRFEVQDWDAREFERQLLGWL